MRGERSFIKKKKKVFPTTPTLSLAFKYWITWMGWNEMGAGNSQWQTDPYPSTRLQNSLRRWFSSVGSHWSWHSESMINALLLLILYNNNNSKVKPWENETRGTWHVNVNDGPQERKLGLGLSCSHQLCPSLWLDTITHISLQLNIGEWTEPSSRCIKFRADCFKWKLPSS